MTLKMQPETYNVQIETLAPLHIGTGDTLRRDYDFAVYGGKTWIVNSDVLAERLYDDNDSFEAMLMGSPLSDLLIKEDFDESDPLWRYVASGVPKATSQNAEVRELIKDVWDQPYIPGSSLKGALRTALFYALFSVNKMSWSVNELNDRAKYAASPVEQKVFGKTPNTDLMRAIQVSDSTPDGQRRIHVWNLVATKTSDGTDEAAPITLEAMSKGVQLSATVTFDTYLLNQAAHPDIGWDSKQTRWLQRLNKASSGWLGQRIEAENTRLRSGEWAAQFREIAERLGELPENQSIIQLGWGGGWDSKTLGDHLTGQPVEFKKLVDKYHMVRKGEFRPGDRFPKTRRVVRSGDPERVRGELGWVLLTWERVE